MIADKPRNHGPRVSRWLSRISSVLDRFDPSSPWITIASLALFASGTVVAVSRIRIDASDLRLLPLILLVISAIPMTALTAAEYWASGRIAKRRIPPADAMRTAIVSTAANLLPIPGGVLVKTQALRRRGIRGTFALATQLVMALQWLAVAGLAGALALGIEGEPAALVFGGVSVVAATLGITLLVRLAPERWRPLLGLVAAVETGFVLNAGLRLFLALLALGIRPSVTQVLVLASASVLASYIAVFPGGLGIRELITAALAPLVGLEPAIGFLAAALLRATAILLYIPLLTWTRKLSSGDHTPIS